MLLHGTNDLWNTTRGQHCNVQHYTWIHCAGLHSTAYNQAFKINNFHHLQLQYSQHSPPLIHESFIEHACYQLRKSVVDSQRYLVSWPTGPTHMHYKWVLHNDRMFLVITATWCLYFATMGHISHRNGTEQNNDANFSCLFHWMYFIYI